MKASLILPWFLPKWPPSPRDSGNRPSLPPSPLPPPNRLGLIQRVDTLSPKAEMASPEVSVPPAPTPGALAAGLGKRQGVYQMTSGAALSPACAGQDGGCPSVQVCAGSGYSAPKGLLNGQQPCGRCQGETEERETPPCSHGGGTLI